MKKVLYAVLAVAVSGAATPALAQLPFPVSIEGRVGAAFPTGDFGDDLDTGLSLSGSLAVGVAPGFGLYASYNHTSFGLSGSGAKVVDSGASVGVTASLPMFNPRVAPYLGAGLVFHNLDVDVDDGPDLEADTDLGFEVGAGLAVQVAPRVRITPAVGYRRYDARMPAIVGSTDVDVSYLTLGIGLNIGF